MSTNYILEVCAFNIQSCIIAELAGAKRVELCDNPKEGGTTPSYGTIQRVKERVNIAVYPIIRPRAGDFLYNEDELAIMRKDIELSKQLGCEGISTGVQLEDGIATPRDAVARSLGKGRWEFEVTITEGRKREVRRLCKALGLTVERLVRTRFGPVTLGTLPAGGTRQLTKREREAIDALTRL